jgi:hypothetical protein
MLKIQYEDGVITVHTSTGEYRITEIHQLYLVQDKLNCYRKCCKDEQTHRMFTATLDLLSSAKDNFLRYHELKCSKNWLYTL